MLAIVFPPIDPVLVQIGPLAVRWYSLAYIGGILLGWWLLNRLIRYRPEITRKHVEDMVVWAILGVVLGGRIGYVLFYQPQMVLEDPLEMFKLWHGGMSFHGGLLGMISATWLFCRSRKLQFFRLMDLIAIATPIGLFLGRIANFVNGELYGRVTDVPWGIIFPHGGELPRHPSQLYEAVTEGLLLFLLLLFLAKRTNALQRTGFLSGVFLTGYWCARTTCELFREPDAHLGFIWMNITMGQILSLPMLLLGVGLMVCGLRQKEKAQP